MSYPPETHYLDHVFSGDVQFTGTIGLPSGSLTDAMVAASANVTQSKLEHRHVISYHQVGGTDVVSATIPLYLAYKGVTVLGVEAMAIAAPTGGDKKFTIDVKKSTAGGAAATILTAVLDFASKTNLTAYAATLSGTPTMIATDMLEVVIAASGSTGSQGQGLVVNIYVAENGA